MVNCDDPAYKDGYGTTDGCQEMSFKDWISYWKDRIVSRRTDGGSSSHSHPATEKADFSDKCLYMKVQIMLIKIRCH